MLLVRRQRVHVYQRFSYQYKCLSTSKWRLQVREIPKFDNRDSFPSDSEIATAQTPRQISDLADDIGILSQELEAYGNHKAKIKLEILNRFRNQTNRQDRGKYIVVGGITPTPLGEGKTTCVLGLVQAFNSHLKKPAIACIRQPSQGPIFGIKGGAAGGGFSQVIPMDEFNLHLTGDIHAVTAANNLLAAAIDARMFHERNLTDKTLYQRLVRIGAHSPKAGTKLNEFTPSMQARLRHLGIDDSKVPENLTEEERSNFARLSIDPNTISVNRVVDTNDRMLRAVEIGRGEKEKGFVRDTGFDISVASEIMAILALSTSLKDMKDRISRMVFAMNIYGEPLTVQDLSVDGAIAALLRDAIKPNLMQTLDGSPVLVHAGPFANIAHGNSSILADEIALNLVGNGGFVITEAGFGADMGIEKFCNIKSRASGLIPDCAVLVATIRALKVHGGAKPIVAGQSLSDEFTQERVDLVEAGCVNLERQIQNIKAFGLPVVVAVSPFPGDTSAELEVARQKAIAYGADDAVLASYHSEGGYGGMKLAVAVDEVCAKYSQQSSNFEFLYDLEDSIERKMEKIVTKMYGANGFHLEPLAREQLQSLKDLGFTNLPLCMAKTQYSLSHDPKLVGSPQDFTVPVKELRLSSGAGFICVFLGEISTMPGLPTRPSFHDIRLEDNGSITGLF